jgi:hypothetical protein
LISDDGLACIADHVPKLEYLFLSRTRVTNAGIGLLSASLSKLSHLALDATRVTGNVLTSDLLGRLYWISISGLSLDSAAMKRLAGSKCRVGGLSPVQKARFLLGGGSISKLKR